MRLLRWILVACAFALIVPAAAGAAAGSGDWRLGYYESMDSLNPFAQNTSSAITAAGMSYEFLFSYAVDDQGPDLEHSLGKSHQVSEDGRTWTIELQDDITWSDGKPFTSADVKWTYDAVLSDPGSPLASVLRGVKRVRAPGPHEIVLELDEPNGSIASAPIYILPAHVWSKLTKKEIQRGQNRLPAVTTGPYVIEKFDPRGDTVMTANPRYRFGKPKANRVVWIKYGDQAAMLRDLRLEQIDATYQGRPDWVRRVANDKRITTWSSDAPTMVAIAFNSCPPGGAGTCERPGGDANVEVVQDPAIRKALGLALDRERIVDTVFDGQARPGLTGMIPPSYRNYAPEPAGNATADVEAARKALADGGWDCAQKPCRKGDVKASFKLLYDPAYGTDAGLVQRVRAQAADVGIEIKLDARTFDAQQLALHAPGSKSGTFRPNYDAVVSTWSDLPFAPDVFMGLLRTGSSLSETYHSDPEYDRLLDQGQRTVDVEQRSDLYRQANALALRDQPYVVVANMKQIAFTSTDSWHGYRPSPPPTGVPWGMSAFQMAGIVPGPGDAAAAAGGDDGGSSGVIVAVIAVVAAAGGGMVVWRRRRGDGADDESDWTEA